MNNDTYEKSVIVTATITNKSENQDSYGEYEGHGFSTLFIADGLGAFIYPRLSSERVVDFFKISAKNLDNSAVKSPHPKFHEIFKQAKQKLLEFAIENKKETDKDEKNLYGTTAITVFETIEKISLAYVGNGAAWHIRGNFNDFPESYHFPWNAVNYLNPHSVSENGKEVLYKLISDSENNNECIPSVIEIEKDTFYGDIIMICTDGIYSADQLKAGKNDKGVWVRYEPVMLKFFEYMKHFFISNQNYSKESLLQEIEMYLQEIKPGLDDDATIGLLLTKEVLNYQNKINWLEKNEVNSSNQV